MGISLEEAYETAGMILRENLDIRTVTLGVNLRDLAGGGLKATAAAVRKRLVELGRRLVAEAEELSQWLGIPIVNKRIAVSPISWLVEPLADPKAPVVLAHALEEAAAQAGVDFVGGFGALVHKSATDGELRLMHALPEALGTTTRVCGFLNLASTASGINMDAVVLTARLLKEMAAFTPMACARFVAFANAPEDNPFMAGAFHGPGEGNAALNVGISGPGVVRAVVSRHPNEDLTTLSELIRRTVFKITRAGELVGRELAARVGVEFGVVDISLAPTTAPGDSVAEILKAMGLEEPGAPGTSCALALLVDAVKKGGAMASGRVGGLSGTFIPVSEDLGMIEAVERGALSLEKLEALTAVCSVGLDMFAVPGETPPETIAAIIADELSIGVVNNKTTGVRVIPAPGLSPGQRLELGGLMGSAPVMEVSRFSPAGFIRRGGRMPAPIQALRN